MKLLVMLIALLQAACSPPAEKQAAKSGEDDPVLYSAIEWREGIHYLKGKRFTGAAVQFHKNGALMSKYHLKDGLLHGLVGGMKHDGKQKTKTTFERGRHEGDNFYWNPDGSLQVHKVWKGDVLVSETPGPANP